MLLFLDHVDRSFIMRIYKHTSFDDDDTHGSAFWLSTEHDAHPLFLTDSDSQMFRTTMLGSQSGVKMFYACKFLKGACDQ